MLRLKITHSNGTSPHPDRIDKSGALKCGSTLSNEPPRHSQESYVHSARQTLCLPGGTHACWVTFAPVKWPGTIVGIHDRKPRHLTFGRQPFHFSSHPHNLKYESWEKVLRWGGLFAKEASRSSHPTITSLHAARQHMLSPKGSARRWS
jgi:hypothetical protein